MEHIVGYRGYEIVKDGEKANWRVRKPGQPFLPGEFHEFAGAREEVDSLRGRR